MCLFLAAWRVAKAALLTPRGVLLILLLVLGAYGDAVITHSDLVQFLVS